MAVEALDVATDQGPVLLDVMDGIATISFNRPERHNAFDDAFDARFFRILGELHQLHADGGLRVAILRGNGKSFSSGRDTSSLGKRPEGVSDHSFIKAGHAGTRLLLDLPVPTIAALHGWVIGGSFERALLCDLRICDPTAKMSLPEVAHGVIPDSAGVARLFQMAGHGLASDLALTGRVMDADEALRHGVVSRVVAQGELDGAAAAMAAEIASRNPLAVALARDTIRELSVPQVDATLRHELLAQSTMMADPAYRAQRDARLRG